MECRPFCRFILLLLLPLRILIKEVGVEMKNFRALRISLPVFQLEP